MRNGLPSVKIRKSWSRWTMQRYPNRMIAYLSDQLIDTGAVAVDIGTAYGLELPVFPNKQNPKTLFSTGHGAMGYALPAAIGAYCMPGKPVACVCKNGAFQMIIQELQWVAGRNIPVKMIVMNNEALGMIRHLQRLFWLCMRTLLMAWIFILWFFRCGTGLWNFLKAHPGRNDVEKYAGEFLEQDGPGASGDHVGKRHLRIPKTCLGEPIHNQQPYMPKPIFDELMEL